MSDTGSRHGVTSLASQPNAIDELAFAWAAKIDLAPLTDSEQASLDHWLSADSRHAGAFARAMATSVYLNKAVALGPDFDPEPATRPMLPPVPFDRRQMLIGGGAMAIAAVAGSVGYDALRARNRITTAKGVIQRHPLTDGSSMILNTATQVDVAFDSAQRAILLRNGEAWFDVVKDGTRPFLVSAGEVTVRAIGTSFSVFRHDDGSMQVVVAEGTVEVARDGNALIPRLSAGRMARIGRGGSIGETRLSPDAVDRASAWVSGLIDMNGLSLGEAAVQFSRYSEIRIELGDPAVAGLRVSGVYSINNPIGFARDAALSLGLQTKAIDGGVRIQQKNI